MDSPPQHETTAQRIGTALFVTSLLFCSFELAPGWGWFRLDWPSEVYYGIMAAAGALAGALCPKNPIAGVPAGALAGTGALFAQALVLANVAAISSVFLILAALIGMLPGIGLYYGLLFLLSFRSSFEDFAIADTDSHAPTTDSEQALLDATGEIPKGCPVCKSEKFRKKQSDAYLALLADRVCLDCGTRYAPATPRWTGLVFMLCALVAFACSAGIIIVSQLGAAGGKPRLGNEMVIAAIAAVLGVVCVVQGFRCLLWPAPCRVVEERKGPDPR